jgi:signal transduction histidine kinase
MENQKDLIIIATAGCLGMLLILSVIFAFFISHRKKMVENEAKIRDIQHEKEIDIFKASTEAEDKQKLKIARDLHDTIGSSLSAVIRSIDKNIKDYESNKFNLDRMKEDLRTIELAKDNLRNISHDLIPPNILTYGLIKSLGYYMNTIRDIVGSKADFENKTQFEENLPFSETDELKIFQICTEIINNLLKHSKYKYLKVTVENDKNSLSIDFTHDGKGISNNEVDLMRKTGAGVGLNSIFARAMRVNADINYSIEQGSASVNLTIPFKA